MISDQIKTHHSFGSGNLGAKRNIHIYLPPDYGSDKERRFPVLYMQDGQNLFDPKLSFAGTAWGIDETAQKLIQRKAIPSLIIVSIENAGHGRINEYTPVRYRGKGGEAYLYSRFIIEEIKAFIDSEYRTLPGREFTGIGGSSLGGLFSLYVGLKRPDIFSRLAVMSPSLWWGGGHILHEALALPKRIPSRIWLDIGKREGMHFKNQTNYLERILLSKGWQKNRNPRFADFRYLEAPKAGHDEYSWGARFDKVLKFLYPKI
jgi:predicted alpha/beta superfamily hydrolase